MQCILCNSPARSELRFIGAAYPREADHHLDHLEGAFQADSMVWSAPTIVRNC
jgi:hypothetical protein